MGTACSQQATAGDGDGCLAQGMPVQGTSMALWHVSTCPLPAASLVRTDPKAGWAEDANAREGVPRDGP